MAPTTTLCETHMQVGKARSSDSFERQESVGGAAPPLVGGILQRMGKTAQKALFLDLDKVKIL